MKALLTGHKGFIGSHYLPVLEKDYDVTTADKNDKIDLCNIPSEFFGKQLSLIHI